MDGRPRFRDNGLLTAQPYSTGLTAWLSDLTLAGLEAGLGLVDHIDPAFTPDNLVVAVSATQRFQRITDFHSNLAGFRFGCFIRSPAHPVKRLPITEKTPAAPSRWVGRQGVFNRTDAPSRRGSRDQHFAGQTAPTQTGVNSAWYRLPSRPQTMT